MTRARLLRATPRGSDSARVRAEDGARRWPSPKQSRYGFVVPAERGTTGLPSVVGDWSWAFDIGTHYCPLAPLGATTVVYVGFDRQGRLVDVDVLRQYEGP